MGHIEECKRVRNHVGLGFFKVFCWLQHREGIGAGPDWNPEDN